MAGRTRTVGVAAVAALAVAPASAPAITNGMPDDGSRSFVGGLVSHDGKHRKLHLICSGTLVSPTAFLTAAHCLGGEPAELYVSFDPFVGAPDVGPGVELHPGTAVAHPDFVSETAAGDSHDLAVVDLDPPVLDVAPAPLAAESALDRIAGSGRTARTAWELVGYGREGHDGKAFFGGGSRRFAFGAFSRLEAFKLHLDQTGTIGGTCNGDSGGPVLVDGAVVGVVSDGDPECRVNGVYYRTDTASARAFLDDHMELPAPAPGPSRSRPHRTSSR